MAHKIKTKASRSLQLWLMIMTIGVCLGACAPEHSSYSRFHHFPNQTWHKPTPVRFSPEWPDSSAAYDMHIAIRHTQMYPYANLPIIIDLISDSGTVSRHRASLKVSDGNGNWTGSGFGTLFQCATIIATELKPQQAHHVVVWLGLAHCDSVQGVNDIGISLTKR